MSSKIRSIQRQAKNGQEEDIEALGAKARNARQQKCTDAVNKVLEEHNCTMNVVVLFGEQPVLLSQVLNLPAQVRIMSK